MQLVKKILSSDSYLNFQFDFDLSSYDFWCNRWGYFFRKIFSISWYSFKWVWFKKRQNFKRLPGYRLPQLPTFEVISCGFSPGTSIKSAFTNLSLNLLKYRICTLFIKWNKKIYIFKEVQSYQCVWPSLSLSLLFFKI